jgi:hypothetical protein
MGPSSCGIVRRTALTGSRCSEKIQGEAGGSFGLLDREAGVAAADVMNRLGKGVWLDDRGQALLDAIYLGLGYRSNASGA